MLNLFSGKKKRAQSLLKDLLSKLLEDTNLLLSFQIEKESEKENFFIIDIFGEDEALLKAKKGRLLQAFQIYFIQALYKAFPDEKFRLIVDSNGFWQEQEDRLLSLTEQLIKQALETNCPVVFKQSLSPFQRRLVHEKASGNTGVRSQSYGTGFYKNMKLIPDTFRSNEG